MEQENARGGGVWRTAVAQPGDAPLRRLAEALFVPNSRIDRFFAAVIQSVDEAVLNAMFANETMTGFEDRVVEALPVAEVRSALQLA